MSLIVQKYGGTSVGTPERILKVAQRILKAQATGEEIVVVVSAMSGVTDNLIGLARQVADHPSEREMDMLLATGEQTTIALTAMAINALGGKAVSLTGAQAGIVTDGVHTKAKIANITPKRIHRLLDGGHIVERGDHRELIARGGVYATMWARQQDAARHEAAMAEAE